MSRGWHVVRDGPVTTLARQLPPRFDVMAETTLPEADPLRLAHQIRQDMWRALRRVRGFSPVIQVRSLAGGVHVQAGGRVLPPVAPSTEAQVRAVLHDPQNRARWVRHARRGRMV